MVSANVSLKIINKVIGEASWRKANVAATAHRMYRLKRMARRKKERHYSNVAAAP